ncbi:type I-B CRISPR-associated endonuclease Cas1b [Picrophilus oshimae]|uniref:CRISPR-associated endonuclease Cas1 n=1 Tax=Picrophilus torridus (strain ATCC 700027 / DSM 9790 / JCM 10055 / NBRC 100828 / KAW 2/3) TaxID=1122961 RepID=A0A8G2L7R6_PICTO|nr:type I-B CRISPR-associated endonuclease Cas1b [Picrophilus oshimae]SMD31392.1 CRISP-associated protein Cas1 [Picrophilus oshimae DSM 9789]
MKKSIYIFSSGNLKRDENTILIENQDGRKYIPIENTSEIYAFGEINFNTRLLNYLSEKGILIHYFNYYGYYSGSIYPREHLSSGAVILNQVKYYIDSSKRLEIARLIEKGAVDNILINLKYYNNRGRDLDQVIEKIEHLKESFDTQNDINSLMLVEAKIRELYYYSFNEIISNKNFSFERRTKRPPKDNINSMLSFVNSILYTTILGEIYKTHMDPRIGYLHETNFRRFTLNLDISEIFKPIIADRVIFKLINENIIKESNFNKIENIVSIDNTGKKSIIEELDKKLETTISYPGIPHKVSYRRLIRLEVYKLEKHILGDKLYVPYKSGW